MLNVRHGTGLTVGATICYNLVSSDNNSILIGAEHLEEVDRIAFLVSFEISTLVFKFTLQTYKIPKRAQELANVQNADRRSMPDMLY